MWRGGKTEVGLIGQQADLGYAYEPIGPTAEAVAQLADEKTAFASALRRAERPAIILGQGALARPDGAAVLRAVAAAAESFGVVRLGWNGWNVLHTAAARVGGLDMGFIPRRGGKSVAEMLPPGGVDALFLLGAAEIDPGQARATVTYVGTHADKGPHRADIVLPGAAYT